MKWSDEKSAEAQKLWAEIKLDVCLIVQQSRQILKKMEKYEYLPRRAISLEMSLKKILTILRKFC